jgi:hypothetical protein
MGKTPIEDWQIQMLACGLEWRGADATGIALVDADGTVSVVKDDEQAWKFVATDEYASFIKEHLKETTQIVLVHTRKYTVGNPVRNENNHPMYAGSGAVVHNGYISNHEEIFRKNGWKRQAETDSDAIRAILDNHGRIDTKLIRKMKELTGGVASAMVHPASPGRLLLLRSGNPLEFGSSEDMLYFASDKRSIFQASKPWTKRWKIWMQVHRPDIAFTKMADDSAWLIDIHDGGLAVHEEFKLGFTTRRGACYDVHNSNFLNRKKGFARDAALETERQNRLTSLEDVAETTVEPKIVLCPNPKCSAPLEVEEGVALDVLRCSACKTSLKNAVAPKKAD